MYKKLQRLGIFFINSAFILRFCMNLKPFVQVFFPFQHYLKVREFTVKPFLMKRREEKVYSTTYSVTNQIFWQKNINRETNGTCKACFNWSKNSWKFGFVVSELVVGSGGQYHTSENHNFMFVLFKPFAFKNESGYFLKNHLFLFYSSLIKIYVKIFFFHDIVKIW